MKKIIEKIQTKKHFYSDSKLSLQQLEQSSSLISNLATSVDLGMTGRVAATTLISMILYYVWNPGPQSREIASKSVILRYIYKVMNY